MRRRRLRKQASGKHAASAGDRTMLVNALDHLAVVAAELGQFERAAQLLGYADHWHETNTEFFRDLTEQRSCAQTRALLASALSDEDRDRLMREGAGWSEDKVAEEALAI